MHTSIEKHKRRYGIWKSYYMIKDSANDWARVKVICLHKYKVCVPEKSLTSWLNPFFGK